MLGRAWFFSRPRYDSAFFIGLALSNFTAQLARRSEIQHRAQLSLG